MFYIDSFFQLGDPVRVCDPDSALCGFFGYIVGRYAVDGRLVEYSVEFVPGQIIVQVLPTMLEPN